MNEAPDQLSLNIKLDDSVSLEKFIYCETNKTAIDLIKGTLAQDSISNLFYIWGKEGVGKSYIVQALNKDYILKGRQTCHISLSDKRITSPEIFQNLGSLDVLFIEDIESLPKDKDWEIQIFSLINDVFEKGTRIYLTSNTVSKDLDIELIDLHSRLSYFTAIEIPEITQEEKIDALLQASLRRGIDLDTKTIQYIVNHTSRSLSDLLSLINELDNFSLKKKKKVTPFLVRELLKIRSNNHRR